jgi:hypothetical protein
MNPRHRTPAQSVAGHQHLAFAVFRQAILDAANPVAPPAARDSARRFLAGDGMYRFWSAVATGRRPTRLTRNSDG